MFTITFPFVAPDGNGNVVALVGPVIAAAVMDTPHRSSTGCRNTETAYYYYGTRYYSPGLPPAPSGS